MPLPFSQGSTTGAAPQVLQGVLPSHAGLQVQQTDLLLWQRSTRSVSLWRSMRVTCAQNPKGDRIPDRYFGPNSPARLQSALEVCAPLPSVPCFV